MIFPNKDFADWFVKFPDDKLRNVLRDIERPLREVNASFRVKKLCLHQLTLQCKVLLERIPYDLITKYKKQRRHRKQIITYSSSSWKQQVIEEKRKLKRLLQNTEVLKKKSRLSSVFRRRLSILIRKNILQAKMSKQRLRSMHSSKENCNEKNGKTQIVKTSNIKSSKAGLRKKPKDCIEAQNKLFSDFLIIQDNGSLKTNMNKSNVESTGQEQVSKKIVCPVTENGHKSSHNLKRTIEMPHEEMLPSVSNLPKKKVPIVPLNKLEHKQAAIGSKKLCKRKYTESVNMDKKSVLSSIQHESAPVNKTRRVYKPKECYSVKNKSNNIITIKKEIKPASKLETCTEKSRESAHCDKHKRAGHNSLDKETSEQISLPISTSRKTVTSIHSDAQQKIKSSEHKSHHKEKSKSHENKSSHENKKSSCHRNDHKSTKETSDKRSSSHQTKRKHKTKPKETSDKSCINRSEEKNCKSSDNENVHSSKSVPHSNETTEADKREAVESLMMLSNSNTVEQSPFQKNLSEAMLNTINYDAKGDMCSVKMDSRMLQKFFSMIENIQVSLGPEHKQTLGELNDKQSSITGQQDPDQLNQESVIRTELCTMVENTSHAVTDVHKTEIPLDGNNIQNKKMPLNTEFYGNHGQDKIQNISTLNNSEKHYNLGSIQQQPLSMPLLNDYVSPDEMSNLNESCISHLQSSAGQVVIQKNISNSDSGHQLPIDNILKENEDTMPLDATMHKPLDGSLQSKNSNDVSCHDNLRIKQENLFNVNNTLYKYNNVSCDRVVGNEPDARNIHLANKITPLTSGNVISSTANISKQMEMQKSIKQEEEIQIITQFKQEDKNWLRTHLHLGDYNNLSDRNVRKEPDVVIIDDDSDDSDDCNILKMPTSYTASVPKRNKVAEFSGGITMEAEIKVIYSCIGGKIYDSSKTHYRDNTEVPVQQNGLNLLQNENVSLAGVISLEKYDGNEYVCIENPNYENASMQHSVLSKEVTPLTIKNIISYFKNTLKEPGDVTMKNDKIIVAGKHKVFISCLVFLFYNYQYFFHTISNDTKQLVKHLHMILRFIEMGKEMQMMASSLPVSNLKRIEANQHQLFLKRMIDECAAVFSNLFNHIVQQFNDFRSLSVFYCTLFSLILFQRIVYHLHCADPDNIHKYFLSIRFIIKSLLHCGNGYADLINLLTDKDNSDFVNDFNTVSKSIRVIQSAIEYHCSGINSNKNQKDSDVNLIYTHDMSSDSLFGGSRVDNDVCAPVFPQSPSVSSTQLQENITSRSSVMPDNNPLIADNSETTGLNVVNFPPPYHSILEVMNKSHVPLHRPQRGNTQNLQLKSQHSGDANIVSESSNTYLQKRFSNSQESVGQDINCDLISTNELYRPPVAHSNLHYVPCNEGALGSQNPAQNSNSPIERKHYDSRESGELHNLSTMSANQVGRSPVVNNALNYMPGNEGMLDSQNPTGNTQKLNGKLQRRFNGLHETQGQHHNSSLISDQMSRQSQSNAPRSLNYMSAVGNEGNAPNNATYKTGQPAADTTSESDFYSPEQHKSAQLANTTSSNSFLPAVNINSTMVRSDFLHHSSLSSTFNPPNAGHTNVPQQNQNVYRRRGQEAAKNADNYNNTHSSGSGTSDQHTNTLQRRPQRIYPPPPPPPPPHYSYSNGGAGQRQLPLILPKPPPLYYHDTTTLMMHRQGLLVPFSSNNNNVSSANTSNCNNTSLYLNRSQNFPR